MVKLLRKLLKCVDTNRIKGKLKFKKLYKKV